MLSYTWFWVGVTLDPGRRLPPPPNFEEVPAPLRCSPALSRTGAEAGPGAGIGDKSQGRSWGSGQEPGFGQEQELEMGQEPGVGTGDRVGAGAETGKE